MIRKKTKNPNGKFGFFLLQLQPIISCSAHCEHWGRFFPALLEQSGFFFIGQRFLDFSSFLLLFSGPPSGICPSEAVKLAAQYSRWGLKRTLNLWEGNHLFKQELAPPALARHRCLGLWAAEASAPFMQDCYRATCCLAYISGAGYFCLGTAPKICLQGLYKHFPGCVTGLQGQMCLVHMQHDSQSHRDLEIAFWKVFIKNAGEGQKGGNGKNV